MAYPKMTLYIGSGCSYCQRVLNFLDDNPMPVTVKDVWSDSAAYQELSDLAGRTQVPCLRIEEQFMHESKDIIDKLAEIYETNEPE